jgi:3-oxoacyl-[acyl-carrier protein] reductase
VATSITENGGEALPYGADVTDEAAVHEMVRAANAAFGPVDILVNNALPDYRFDPVSRKDLAHIGWNDWRLSL